MLPIADLLRPLPAFRPALFALTALDVDVVAATPRRPGAGEGDTSSVRPITPALLPLLYELRFETDLILLHSRELLDTALDLCSVYGEGVLVERRESQAVSPHLWARVSLISGGGGSDASSPISGCGRDASSPGMTVRRRGVAATTATYFARDHRRGLLPQAECRTDDPAAFSRFCAQLAAQRTFLRQGAEARSYAHTEDAVPLWQAAVEELALRNGRQPLWNLRLEHSEEEMRRSAEPPLHRVCATLSDFDQFSRRFPVLADRLPALDGRRPGEILSHPGRREVLRLALRTPKLRIEPEFRALLLNALDDSGRTLLKEGIKAHHLRRARELRATDPRSARRHRRLAESVSVPVAA